MGSKRACKVLAPSFPPKLPSLFCTLSPLALATGRHSLEEFQGDQHDPEIVFILTSLSSKRRLFLFPWPGSVSYVGCSPALWLLLGSPTRGTGKDQKVEGKIGRGGVVTTTSVTHHAHLPFGTRWSCFFPFLSPGAWRWPASWRVGIPHSRLTSLYLAF